MKTVWTNLRPDVVGFQMQILRCLDRSNYRLTLNHLENLYGMVTAQDVIALLDNAKVLLMKLIQT